MAEHANYQGEHLGLSLNRDAVFALNDALEQLRYSVSDRGTAAVPLRLPDGRTLQLRLSLTNAGEIRDANGDYLDDDGIAHGDVTGDLAVHAETRRVLDAVGGQDLLWDLSAEQRAGDAPVDLDEVAARRVDAALAYLPSRYGRTDEWVERLRARALDHARAQLSGALAGEREAVARARERDVRRINAPGQRRVPDQPEQSPPGAGESEGRPGKFEAAPDAEALHGQIPDAEAEASPEGSRLGMYRDAAPAGGGVILREDADGFMSKSRYGTAEELDAAWQEAVDLDADLDLDVDAAEPVDRGHEQAEARPPVRLRNRFDDDRRAELEEASQRRGYATQAAADGREGHAGYWAGQAERWTEYAQQSRTAAIAEDDRDRAADPDGYAQRLTPTRTHGSARSAGSDGRSGEAEVPTWVTAAGEHARQANARQAEVPSWVTAAGDHARQANAREAGRAAGSDGRSAGAGIAM